MTQISKAALPPRQPGVTHVERHHPLFSLYAQHRTFSSNNLVQASCFRDWLTQYERNLSNEAQTKRPEYSAFMQWMRDNQGGARKCPAGAFPHNFQYWIDGGRW